MKRLGFIFALAVASLPASADRWRMEYFFDEDRSSLTINDFQFASAERGIAVGLQREGQRTRPVSLVTPDGGKTWSLKPIRENPLTLHFLDEQIGWMVTEKGLWQSSDAGETWRKTRAPRDIFRVHFLDGQRGFAVGGRAGLWATKDGARSWTRVEAVDKLKANSEYTVFTWITFLNPQVGIVAGYNRPPRRTDAGLPSWIDPEKAERRREAPNLGIILETRDGGESWNPSTMSIFGRIAQIRVRPPDESLGLIEFSDTFEYPSEIFRIDLRTGKSERVFRRKDRAITDISVHNRTIYLGGYEVAGRLARTPIPTKVSILRHVPEHERWEDMQVDYRAVARRLMFAQAGGAIWAATDTGMILKLVPDSQSAAAH